MVGTGRWGSRGPVLSDAATGGEVQRGRLRGGRRGRGRRWAGFVPALCATARCSCSDSLCPSVRRTDRSGSPAAVNWSTRASTWIFCAWRARGAACARFSRAGHSTSAADGVGDPCHGAVLRGVPPCLWGGTVGQGRRHRLVRRGGIGRPDRSPGFFAGGQGSDWEGFPCACRHVALGCGPSGLQLRGVVHICGCVIGARPAGSGSWVRRFSILDLFMLHTVTCDHCAHWPPGRLSRPRLAGAPRSPDGARPSRLLPTRPDHRRDMRSRGRHRGRGIPRQGPTTPPPSFCADRPRLRTRHRRASRPDPEQSPQPRRWTPTDMSARSWVRFPELRKDAGGGLMGQEKVVSAPLGWTPSVW